MDLELAYVILKWVVVGFVGAAFACLFIGLILNKCTHKDASMMLIACPILLIFAMIILLPYGVVESKLYPQCSNCEKAVKSAYCPDCGWEAVKERVFICPECGSEWNSVYCGDCGARMNTEET